MKNKILAQLKAKATGVSTEVLTGVADYLATTVTQDDQIETSVAGVIPLLTVMQSENDRRVTAFQQENTTLKAEIKTLKGTAPKKDKDPDQDPDVPAWAQAMIDQNKTLLDEVTALKSENIGKLHQNALIAKLNELGVPEKYYTPAIKGRTYKDEAEIAAFAEEIGNNYKEYAQDLADQGLGYAQKPIQKVNPADTGKPSKAVADYIEAKFEPEKAGAANLGGKKL